jgi:predicted nucleotidyltransferase
MLNLDSRYATIVRKILRDHIPDKTVWVYGSRIKGNSHEGSDLDLVIMPSNSDYAIQ